MNTASNVLDNPAEVCRKDLENTIKHWRALRADRLDAEKFASGLKAQETTAKDFIIEAMRSQAMEGVIIDSRMSYVREREFPVADDRAAVCAHILATGDLSLLQFRLAEGAVKEQLEDGVEIPGVSMMSRFELGDKKA